MDIDSLPFDSLTLEEINQGINDCDMALLNPARTVTIAGTWMERQPADVIEAVLWKLKARRRLLLGALPEDVMPGAGRYYRVSMGHL